LTEPRRQVAVLVALWAGATAVALLVRPPIPPDETRYLAVAWEMWVRGDFLVPYLNGAPYSDKPPLLFWLMQLGWAVGGVGATWPRLIGPLCAIAAAFLLVPLAQRLWPERQGAGWAAALVLPGTLGWTVYGSLVLFDMLLVVGVLVAIIGVLDAWRRGGIAGWLLCALGLGWGLLAKGPVALLHILPVPMLAPLWMRERRPERWSRWYLGLGLAVLIGVVLVLAWAVPAGLGGGPAYRDAIFLRQTADRMVAGAAHGRPLWWYLPVVPVLLLPWLVWPGAWRGLAALRGHGNDSGVRLVVAWLAVVFLSFCLISGKQAHYLLPLMPGLLLLWARGWQDGPAERSASLGGPATLLVLGGLAILLLPLVPGLQAAQPWTAAVSRWPAMGLLALAAGLLVAGPRQPAPHGPLLVSAAGIGFAALVHLAAMPGLRPLFDTGPLAARLRHWQEQGVAIAHTGKYNGQWHFEGRLTEPFAVLGRSEDPAGWQRAHPRHVVISYAPVARGPEREAAGAECLPYRDRLVCLAVADSSKAR